MPNSLLLVSVKKIKSRKLFLLSVSVFLYSAANYTAISTAAERIFVPILPLFEESNSAHAKKNTDSSSPNLSLLPYATAFATEEQRSYAEKLSEIQKVFPQNEKLISLSEATVCLVVKHGRAICDAFVEGK